MTIAILVAFITLMVYGLGVINGMYIVDGR